MDEKVFKPISGWFILMLSLVIVILIVLVEDPIFKIISGFVLALVLLGFIIVNPNNSKVMTLLENMLVLSSKMDFIGPIRFSKRNLSLRARNFESDRLKVNDKRGNPIQIGVILVWKVRNTFKAQFEVEDYLHFVKVQTDAAVRKLAGSFPTIMWMTIRKLPCDQKKVK